MFLGDSLTAGFGLLSEQAFPALVQKKFADEGYTQVEVVNAGISGDTTAGGLRRVERGARARTRILVVALGGNDALRGLTVAQTHDNLAAIIDAARGARASASCCAAWKRRPISARTTATAFRDVFMQLVREYSGQIAFVPFLLEGVAGNPALNQADGIHPERRGRARSSPTTLYPKLRDDGRLSCGGGRQR